MHQSNSVRPTRRDLDPATTLVVVILGPPATYRRTTEIRPADRVEALRHLPMLAEGGGL